MRGSLEERLHVATEIIDNGKDSDRLGALTFLARFGLGGEDEDITVDAELLNKFFNVIEFYVQDAVALADIREKWLAILADRLRA